MIIQPTQKQAQKVSLMPTVLETELRCRISLCENAGMCPTLSPSTCQAVGCPLEDPVINTTAAASAFVWLTV